MFYIIYLYFQAHFIPISSLTHYTRVRLVFLYILQCPFLTCLQCACIPLCRPPPHALSSSVPLSPSKKLSLVGRLGGSAVEGLPLAQGVIPGSKDQVPHWAPCVACFSLSLCLFLSLMNK